MLTQVMNGSPVSPRVDVIIPALNEEQAIGAVVAGLPRPLVRQVIVVDNGSTDRTALVARDAGATVVQEPRRGYGSACLKGISALSPDADIIAFVDGDGSDHPEDLARVVAPVALGTADLVIGARRPVERG